MVLRLGSPFLMRRLAAASKQPRQSQEALLSKWIKRDADTQYGKQHNFKNIKTLTDLQAHHPLTYYEHYREYVQQMANGEVNVLTCEGIVRFAQTSGTTGKGKMIPLTKLRVLSTLELIWLSSFGAVAKKYGWGSPAQKDIVLVVNPRVTRSTSGHRVSSLFFVHSFEYSLFLPAISSNVWEIFSIVSEFEELYLTILFGISDKNINRFFGIFSCMVHKAMELLENNWEQIVNDIAKGKVDEALDITPEVRNACDRALLPDPRRAQDLKEEFEKGFDGIMRRVWPNMTCIVGIETSGYTAMLTDRYARGIPIFSPMFAGTEGTYGVNLWPGEGDKFTLVPYSLIYEFIPEDDMSENQPATLLIDEVEKGQIYEMVVSIPGGLYRYRFGDVIEVVDFYNATPVVKFLYRSGQLLNMRAEKVTEVSVHEAVQRVASHWSNSRLVQWTSAESTLLSEIPDFKKEFDLELMEFYLVFIELEGNVDPNVLDEKLQQEFDTVLADINCSYLFERNNGSMARPFVFLVKPGTFDRLRTHIINTTTASYTQFKVPRKLKTTDTLTLMLNARFETCVSFKG